MPVFDMEIFGNYRAVTLKKVEYREPGEEIRASPMPHADDGIPGQVGMVKLHTISGTKCKANVYLDAGEGVYDTSAVYGKDYEFITDEDGCPIPARHHVSRGVVLKVEVK